MIELKHREDQTVRTPAASGAGSLREFLVCGRPALAADLVPLRAGRLTLFFDPETISIRRICLENREVIRGIYGAVRDSQWGTVPPRLQNLSSSMAADSFRLSFEVSCQQEGIDFFWRGEITGKSDSTVRYSFDGEARTTFLRNRIGLCVLHPILECAGVRASFARKNNWQVELALPRNIEPQIRGDAHFADMRTLAHEIRRGEWAHLDFEGEIFEMEDQRNWTDASFKTYAPSLGRPFPVETNAGSRISQSVTLSLTRDPTERAGRLLTAPVRSFAPALHTNAPLKLPDEASMQLPHLGLGWANHDTEPGATEVRRLAALRLAHLRVDLHLASPSWRTCLTRAAGEAKAMGAGLEMALHLPPQNDRIQLNALRDALHEHSIVPNRVIVFRDGHAATNSESLKLVRDVESLAGVPIGGGSNAHFCELNRARTLGEFDATAVDFVSWPITPQVHAFDDRSILETLEAQPHTATTARLFAEGRPLVVSPVTLRPRLSATGTSAKSPLAARELPAHVDPRQMSLFAAAWTLGSVAALTAAEVSSATYFETTGWSGLMETADGSPLRDKFPSIPGAVFPVYFVFAALAGFHRAAPVAGADTGSMASLVLFDDTGRRRIMLANLTDRGSKVEIEIGKTEAHGWMVDEANVEVASRKPGEFLRQCCRWTTVHDAVLEIELKRYAVAWFDLE